MLRPLFSVCVGVSAVAAGVGGFTQSGAQSAPMRVAVAVSTPQLSQLLGFSNGAVIRVDPNSLQPLPGAKLQVGSGGCAGRNGGTACWANPPWSASPNGQRLAVARNGTSAVEIIDATRLQVLASVPIGGGSIGALAWLTPNRVLGLQEGPGGGQRLLVLDLPSRRVVARRALGGSVQRLSVAGRQLALLVSPAQKIGLARLAVASATGAVRFVQLGEIRAGSKVLATKVAIQIDTQLPGLAVDPRSGHAFVVDEGRIGDIGLAPLSVSYHALRPRTLFLSRLVNWLQPAAAAKEFSGHVREARWLGGGLLAVSGADTAQGQTQPAGLLLIDTGNGSVRTIDRDVTSFDLADDLLLATGERSESGHAVGIGLRAYGFDGGKRFQVLDGQPAWLGLAYGGRAYVGVSGQDPLTILDLAAGDVVGERTQTLPTLLLGEGAGWWQQPISP